MSTRHLVDPELLPMLDMLPQADFTPERLPEARAMTAQRVEAMPGPAPSQVVTIDGPDGAPRLEVRLFHPPGGASAKGAVLHVHGGGFIVGSAAMNDAGNAAMAERNGVLVASVDYRLAPETPFPGPLEDCFAALIWLQAHSPGPIVVAGESAGGGLAAALALLARDRGLPPLSGQLLTYPMLDPASADSLNGGTGEFVWTRNSNRFGWSAMRGTAPIPQERLHHFAPALCSNLGGVAPAYIAVGSLDLFLDEDLAYAAQLSSSGVPVEMHVYPGAFHGFELMPGARVAARYRADLTNALDRFLE